MNVLAVDFLVALVSAGVAVLSAVVAVTALVLVLREGRQ